jgi:DNA-binding GntR family transcriptional regulator
MTADHNPAYTFTDRGRTLTISGGHELAASEHALILAACQDRDAERAAKLVFDHILGASRSLQRHTMKMTA